MHPTIEAFDAVFDRLVAFEIEAMRAAEIRGEHPSFEEIIEFYGRTRFLYPGKLGALQARFSTVADTWRQLVAANGDIFQLLVLHRVIDNQLVAMNSVCAFEYVPGTWQGQHLVSGERHEYSGTLAAMIGLIHVLHGQRNADHIRLTFRPSNPGVRLLFGGVADYLPTQTSHLLLRRHVIIPMPAHLPVGPPVGIDVHSLRGGDQRAAKVYQHRLHPVELESLHLEDPRLAALNERYRQRGLYRSRQILLASLGERVLGAAICNLASEGMNFSFLENAVEEIALAPGIGDSELRDSVLRALLHRICQMYADAGRDYLVLLLDDVMDRVLPLLDADGNATKQYGILTISRRDDSFLQMKRFFTDYYRSRLIQSAVPQEHT
jgi:hypothetical protein